MTNWKSKLLAFLHDPPHKPRAVAADGLVCPNTVN
jgi:hypothetical protein